MQINADGRRDEEFEAPRIWRIRNSSPYLRLNDSSANCQTELDFEDGFELGDENAFILVGSISIEDFESFVHDE